MSLIVESDKTVFLIRRPFSVTLLIKRRKGGGKARMVLKQLLRLETLSPVGWVRSYNLGKMFNIVTWI